MWKTYNKTRWLLTVIALLLIGIKISNFSMARFKEMSSSTTIDFDSKTLDKEDMFLFKRDKIGLFRVDRILKNTERNPVKLYIYDNKYDVFVSKIEMSEDYPLDSFIISKKHTLGVKNFSASNLSSNRERYTFGVGYGDVFKSRKTASKIILSIDSDVSLQQQFYSVNAVGYSLPVKTFEIQYDNETEPVDIRFATKEKFFMMRDSVMINLTFYKHEKTVFMVLMVPIKIETQLPIDALSQIMRVSE